jgi:hypothetical protein
LIRLHPVRNCAKPACFVPKRLKLVHLLLFRLLLLLFAAGGRGSATSENDLILENLKGAKAFGLLLQLRLILSRVFSFGWLAGDLVDDNRAEELADFKELNKVVEADSALRGIFLCFPSVGMLDLILVGLIVKKLYLCDLLLLLLNNNPAVLDHVLAMSKDFLNFRKVELLDNLQ